MEIRSDKQIAKSFVGKISADGHVDGPAREIDTGATYTFEACIDGRWYRWTDQRPTIDGDRFRFVLRETAPRSQLQGPDGGEYRNRTCASRRTRRVSTALPYRSANSPTEIPANKKGPSR